MIKQITQKQIEQVLGTIYQTNITVASFDAIKKFFVELPDVEESKTTDENKGN